jgi:hypothetical protein
VRDEAMRLGCLPEVLRARDILDRGTSADRQLNVHARAQADGASEREAAQAVVDWLIEETMVGIPPDAAPKFDLRAGGATSAPGSEQRRGSHGRHRRA